MTVTAHQIHQVWMKPVHTSEGLLVKCRKCGSEVGVMCVYLAGQWRSSKNHHRAGKTCLRIHNERIRDAADYRVKKWKRENQARDRMLIESRRVSTDSRAAWRSMLEWERERHEELRLWLETYGYILMDDAQVGNS